MTAVALSLALIAVAIAWAEESARRYPPGFRLSDSHAPLPLTDDARQALVETLESMIAIRTAGNELPVDLAECACAELRAGKSLIILDNRNPWSRLADGDQEASTKAVAAEGNTTASPF
jgi:hypothetical protein